VRTNTVPAPFKNNDHNGIAAVVCFIAMALLLLLSGCTGTHPQSITYPVAPSYSMAQRQELVREMDGLHKSTLAHDQIDQWLTDYVGVIQEINSVQPKNTH